MSVLGDFSHFLYLVFRLQGGYILYECINKLIAMVEIVKVRNSDLELS